MSARTEMAFTFNKSEKEFTALTIKQSSESMSKETCAVLTFADAEVTAKSARDLAARMTSGKPYRDELKQLERDVASLQSSMSKLRRAIRRERRAERKDEA